MDYLDDFKNFFGKTVGYDDMLKHMTESTKNFQKVFSYPPYNIRKVDDTKYVIEIALAGFGKQDLELTLDNSTLTVKGEMKSDSEDSEYIFKGIAERAFTRSFNLADSVTINNAEMINGMLKIWLERLIPESKKPRKIDIEDKESSKRK